MKKTKTKNKITSKTLLLNSVLVIILSVGTVLYLNKKQNLITDKSPVPQIIANDTSDYVNLQPATEQDNVDVNNTKIEINKDNEQTDTEPKTTSGATVIITYSGQSNGFVEVSSYVQNIFEDGGECSLKLTKGSEDYSTKSTGVMDAKYTLCPTFSIPDSELAAGKWSGEVSYKSDKNSGMSDTFFIEVIK